MQCLLYVIFIFRTDVSVIIWFTAHSVWFTHFSYYYDIFIIKEIMSMLICHTILKQNVMLPCFMFLYRCPSTGGTGQYELLPLENTSSSSINIASSAGLNQSCIHDETVSDWVSVTLGCACVVLMVATAILSRKVFVLRKRPRIKKRIIVNKNVTPLTSRPSLPPEQCEITIENCCNMNICETVSIYSAFYIMNNCNFNDL